MSVRVVARIRPLLKAEAEKDVIVQPGASTTSSTPTAVTLPDPKHPAQNFTFNFASVYDRASTQQDLFDNEVSPMVKHLFAGFDVTIFAYGVTGTGKTHTMRGGKSMADRGVIPRLLSSIYRRQRKIEKDSEGVKTVNVALSYYEIYNDKVFDLLEPPENRTLAGLPIRDNNGKTVISGLTERSCTTLKEFEQLYDEANVNRSTSATKLNAHSSRSHAILQVKLTQVADERTTVSMVSAIDLAGSEDNRRTDNNKERLVESSSINKSLFVLAQCVEAISKKQARIPYRESKMTRILSLGQNNGFTIMILNLAPVRSYHLDTLSSLNFANRTKKIEVREVENEPFYGGKLPSKLMPSLSNTGVNRQPLRPIPTAANVRIKPVTATTGDKPAKSFSVYAEKRPSPQRSLKRTSDANQPLNSRPSKIIRPSTGYATVKPTEPGVSRSDLEQLVNRMVDEKLAKQALADTDKATAPALSEDIQKRLDALEQRVEQKEDNGRAEGLQYLLMAKQHTLRGEDSSALRMYQLALPFFPNNEKLANKMLALQEKMKLRKEQDKPAQPPQRVVSSQPALPTQAPPVKPTSQPRSALSALPPTAPAPATVPTVAAPITIPTSKRPRVNHDADDEDNEDEYKEELQPPSDDEAYSSDASFSYRSKSKTKSRKPPKSKSKTPPLFVGANSSSSDPLTSTSNSHFHVSRLDPVGYVGMTPRTSTLLRIINTRDLSQIRLLRGVGLKKAEAIVSSLCDMDDAEAPTSVGNLRQLGGLKGVGVKTVENMRSGIVA